MDRYEIFQNVSFFFLFQGLIKALNMLNERYGKVHIDFAEPISVRDLFQSSGLHRVHSTLESPHVQHTLSVDEMAFCVDVAHRVLQKQQRHAVISAFNLISIILNNSVVEGTGPPPLNEVVANVSWLKSVMEMLGALIDIQGEWLHGVFSPPILTLWHQNFFFNFSTPVYKM